MQEKDKLYEQYRKDNINSYAKEKKSLLDENTSMKVIILY